MNKFNLCEINEKLKIDNDKKILKVKIRFKKLSTSINCQFLLFKYIYNRPIKNYYLNII